MDERIEVKDPGSGNVVRFTDNGPKDGDQLPAYQVDEPVEIGPSGKPAFYDIPDGDGPEAPVTYDLIEEDPEDDDS